MTKTIPKKKKCRKAKSEEALQIAVERKEGKGKGEWEDGAQLNAEFQRIPRRDKKAFLNEHGKEMEKNSRMRKTRQLFRKTGDIKETFHSRLGTIKDRNDKDLTEEE